MCSDQFLWSGVQYGAATSENVAWVASDGDSVAEILLSPLSLVGSKQKVLVESRGL